MPSHDREDHRREPRVEFLGEQDGPPERVLKTALRQEFLSYPGIKRAYLARVGYAPGAPVSIGLCIAPKSAEGDAVVGAIGRVFAAQFAARVPLDVLFLTEEQEEDLRRVCHPFVNRA